MNPTEWVASLSTVDGLRLQRGASAHDIDECESTLGSRLLSALRNLYLASDGVWDEPGQWFVIWPLMEVVERNRVASEAESHHRRDWVALRARPGRVGMVIFSITAAPSGSALDLLGDCVAQERLSLVLVRAGDADFGLDDRHEAGGQESVRRREPNAIVIAERFPAADGAEPYHRCVTDSPQLAGRSFAA